MRLLLLVTTVLLGMTRAAILPEAPYKDYQELLRAARSSSESDGHSHEHLNVPGLGIGLPHLHVHHGHHHGSSGGGGDVGDGHVMASWHGGHGDSGSDDSSSSSASGEGGEEYEACLCDQDPGWGIGGNSWPYAPSGRRRDGPLTNHFVHQKFGFRRKGSDRCVCPEMQTTTASDTIYVPWAGWTSPWPMPNP